MLDGIRTLVSQTDESIATFTAPLVMLLVLVLVSRLPQILGSAGCPAGRNGGKNSGKVGKWESRKVAKSAFLKFPDFSVIFL